MKKSKRYVALLLLIVLILSQELNQLQVNATSNFNLSETNQLSLNATAENESEKDIIVTFSAAGGTLSNNFKTVVSGNTYGTLPTPVKEGYTFEGWYTQEKGGNRITEASEVTESDSHFLYAHWNAITCTISFIANGGTFYGAASKEVTFGQKYGELPSASLKDFTFKGWYTMPVGGSQITEDSLVDITSATIFYAQWAGAMSTVSFDANGGKTDISFKKVNYGDVYGSLPVPVREGYTFKGWYLSNEGATEITEASIVTFIEDQTLYAGWSQDGYKVTFDANGGTVSTTSKSVLYGDLYGTLPTPSSTGYTFLGWYTEKENGTRILADNICTAVAAHTLYAHWSANEYKVGLIGYGADLPYSTITVTYGADYSKLPIPELENYVFGGWYTEASSGVKINPESKVTTAAEQILYAHWIGNPFTLRFDPNGGTVSTAEKIVNYGGLYGTLPNPVRTGYTFEGWFSAEDNKHAITSDDTVRLTEDETLSARWTVNKPLITMNANNGTMIVNGEKVSTYAATFTYGDTYGNLPEPERDGYTFAGWFTSLKGNEEVTSDTVVTATVSLTLYAHWAGNPYQVNFDGNSGYVDTISKMVIYGDYYGTLPTPVRENYSFTGWYTDSILGNGIVSGSYVNILKEQTLYAHWKGKSSIVTFNANGGSSSKNTNTVYYGETYNTLPTPYWAGHTFLGWFTDSTGGTPVTNSDKVKTIENQTLYAHWELTKSIITFDADGGYISTDKKTVVYNEPYGFLPEPSKYGYTFEGWFISLKYTSPIAESDIVNFTADITVYAKWKGENVSVYYDANGGSITVPGKQVTYGSSYGTLTAPTRQGYTFNGWYTESSGGTYISSSSTVETLSSQTLYAHWNQEVYTVSLAANGGSISPSFTTVTIGDTYSDLPIPTRVGYSFSGWFNSANDSGTRVYYTTGACTLYAHWKANKYTVYFDGNGGTTAQSSDSVTFGQAYGTLPTPVRKNYVFSGWYTAAVSGSNITSASIVNTAAAHTLYAHWNGVTSKISYDSNGGTAITSTKTVIYGSTYGAFAVPVRTGYTFTGWFTKSSGGEQIEASHVVDTVTDQTLYAHWTVNTPVITYVANGGRVYENGLKVTSSPVTKIYGKPYGELPLAVREGYTFDGWYTSPSGTVKISSASIVETSTNISIYAHWTGISNTVNFNANGGKASPVSMTVQYGSTYGTLPTPTLEGYTFLGWYTKDNGGTSVSASTTVSILDTQTLYAHWRLNTYTVIYDCNGGTVSVNGDRYSSTSRTVIYNGTYGASYGILPNPSRSGYDFKGWYTLKEGGDLITLSTDFKVNATQTLYAQWSFKNITVTLNENNGNPLSATKLVTYGDKYGTLPLPERTYYTFKGWFASSGGGSEITKDTVLTRSDSHAIYAVWTPKNYTVTFNGNGGSVTTASTAVTYEKVYGTLPAATRKYYTFAGWYTKPSGGNRILSDSVVGITSDSVLYAHWVQETYNITFNANGGTVLTTSKNVIYNQTYGTLPVPTRNGYIFNGWYTQKTDGVLISATDYVTVTGSQTLYAGWTAKESNVIFNANGGNLEPTVKALVYGTAYGELPVPVLTHYTFAGWYTASTGGAKVVNTTIFNSTGTQVLYAHWTADTFTVTYNANGGKVSTASKKVSYEGTYGTLTVPTRSNYDFMGWYTAAVGGRLITAASIVNTAADHTLYAHWRGKPCVITLDANGGSVYNSTVTVYLYDTYGELPVPVREGYHFDGWYTAKTNGTLISETDTVKSSGSVTLYAHWSIRKMVVTFDPNGGEVDTDSMTVTYGSSYGELPVPVLEDNTFDGWYTTLEGTEKMSPLWTMKRILHYMLIGIMMKEARKNILQVQFIPDY